MVSGPAWRRYALRRGIAVVLVVTVLSVAVAIVLDLAAGDDYVATAEVSVTVAAAPPPGREEERREVPPVLVPGSDPDGDGIIVGPNARDARPGQPDSEAGQPDSEAGQPGQQGAEEPEPPPRLSPSQLISLAAAAEAPVVTRDVIAQLELSDSPSGLGSDISSRAVGEDMIRVGATRPSRDEARRTANSVAANLAGSIPELPAARDLAPARVQASVTRVARRAATAPDSGGPSIGTALLGGVPLGIVLALLLHTLSVLEARRAEAKASDEPE